MNVMTEPLHRDDKALPRGLHVCPSYSTYNCGSQKTTVQLYNTKDHVIVIKKGTAVARMVAANEFPEMWSQMVWLEPFELEGWPKKAMLSLLSRREGRSYLKSWSSQALSHGQRRTKKELWTYWLNTMTSLH